MRNQARNCSPSQVPLCARERRQPLLDLVGDLVLLRERATDRLDGVFEGRAWSGDGRDRHRRLGVQQVLDDHRSRGSLLDRLAIEVLREERQRLVVVPDCDRDVLLRCPELVGELGVQGIGEVGHGWSLLAGGSIIGSARRRRPPSVSARRSFVGWVASRSAGEKRVELRVALLDADLHAAREERVTPLEGVDERRRR